MQRDNNIFGEFFDTDDKHNTWYVGTKFDEGPFKKFGGALRWGGAFLSEPSVSLARLCRCEEMFRSSIVAHNDDYWDLTDNLTPGLTYTVVIGFYRRNHGERFRVSFPDYDSNFLPFELRRNQVPLLRAYRFVAKRSTSSLFVFGDKH